MNAENQNLVFPGDYLSSAEEAEPGENAYISGDDVYSAAIGRNETGNGKADVSLKGRFLEKPKLGSLVYGMVVKASLNKAILSCISAKEVEGGSRGLAFDAVLPVTSIRRDYVREIRDELRVGDIVKVKVSNIEKSGFEVSMKDSECGVVAAFCPRCRTCMDASGNMFTCASCNWKDRKKIPGESEQGSRYESGREGYHSSGYDRPRYSSQGDRGSERRPGGRFGGSSYSNRSSPPRDGGRFRRERRY